MEFPFPHWPLPRRPRIEWPGGARLAVWIGLNLERYDPGKPAISISPVTRGLVPDPMNEGWRDYGMRVGFWRLLELLDRHGMPASAIVNSDACELYPDALEAGRDRGWAWLGHGQSNSRFMTEMTQAEERPYLEGMADTIEVHTGARPRGWLGPALTESHNTPAVLAELGFTYLCDWCNDDQPYPLRVSEGRMISLPYSVEVNDILLLVEKGMSGPEFERVLVDQFDALYAAAAESGLVMAIPLHPFLMLPFRLKYLDAALAHIASHEDVWLATSDEIADWYLENHYDRALEAVAGGR